MKDADKLRMIGGITGFLSAGFGIGGGAMLVPAYHSLMGYSMRQAAGNSLATIVPIVVVGVIGRILFHHNIDYHSLNIAFVLSLLLGALLASRLIGKLKSGNELKAFFGFFLVLCGVHLAHSFNLVANLMPVGIDEGNVVMFPLLVGYGITLGVISAMLGVGCGLAIVPFFVIVLEVPIEQAIFQSLCSMLVLTSFNAFSYAQILRLDLAGAKRALLPAFLGAVLGLIVTSFLPSSMIKFAFGYLLLFIGIKYIIGSIHQLVTSYHVCT